jgi:hypothetical protein
MKDTNEQGMGEQEQDRKAERKKGKETLVSKKCSVQTPTS